MLSIRPAPIGSTTAANTIGTVRLTCCNAADVVPPSLEPFQGFNINGDADILDARDRCHVSPADQGAGPINVGQHHGQVKFGSRLTVGPKHWERYGLKSWIETTKKRLHHNLLAIALANKLARIAWAVFNKGRAFECVKTDAMAS